MEVLGTIGGGAPVMKRYMAGETMSNAGVPVISTDDGGAGGANIGEVQLMAAAGTALAADESMVGLAIDSSGTISATATTDLFVTVAVNPDLIIRAKMTNGATEDTALTIITTSADSATGVTLTGFTSDDGESVWGYDGANKGEIRKFDSTDGGVAIRFPNAITNGDRFLVACGNRCMASASAVNYPDLSTARTQLDAETDADASADTFAIFDIEAGTEDNDGANNSFYNVVAYRHLFGSPATAD